MASTISRSILSPSTRRVHYQPQTSNASLSLSQSFSTIEVPNITESFSSSFIHSNPLVTIIYSTTSSSKDNQQILLNSYSSCRRLLDHMKPVIGIQHDEIIDLMDNEGKLKDLNTHQDEYASQFLTARNTYYVLKVDTDVQSGDKRYTASFNIDQIDQKLHLILSSSLNSLNKSTSRPVKSKPGSSKPNPVVQSTSNTTPLRTKKQPKQK